MGTIKALKEAVQQDIDTNQFTLDQAERLALLLEYVEELEQKNRDLTQDLFYTSELVDLAHPPSRL